jgi:tRNA A37 threonylcarbamoyladenosine dehydratase
MIGPADEGDGADLERRFGGLRRLYGDAAYARIRAAHVVVVGVGGVGSWAAEALARSGVAALTLIDLDHVSESNVNRQVQALGSTLGMAKVEALRLRIADIHPECGIVAVEEFVDEANWPGLLARPASAVIDACDNVRAKAVIAAWAIATKTPLVIVGAAGGKRAAERVEVGDLAEVTHDPMLASLRQRLRKFHAVPRNGSIGLACVFSREPVAAPVLDVCASDASDAEAEANAEAGVSNAAASVAGPAAEARGDGSLNCHGYGSSVAVTATFGMVAAARALESAALAVPRATRPATL